MEPSINISYVISFCWMLMFSRSGSYNYFLYLFHERPRGSNSILQNCLTHNIFSYTYIIVIPILYIHKLVLQKRNSLLNLRSRGESPWNSAKFIKVSCILHYHWTLISFHLCVWCLSNSILSLCTYCFICKVVYVLKIVMAYSLCSCQRSVTCFSNEVSHDFIKSLIAIEAQESESANRYRRNLEATIASIASPPSIKRGLHNTESKAKKAGIDK